MVVDEVLTLLLGTGRCAGGEPWGWENNGCGAVAGTGIGTETAFESCDLLPRIGIEDISCCRTRLRSLCIAYNRSVQRVEASGRLVDGLI